MWYDQFLSLSSLSSTHQCRPLFLISIFIIESYNDLLRPLINDTAFSLRVVEPTANNLSGAQHYGGG
jgi:hypothetical protein